MKEKHLETAPEKKMTFAEVHGALLHVVREYRAFVALEEILRQAKTVEQDLRDLEKAQRESEAVHLQRQREFLAAEEKMQKQIEERLASVKEQAEHDIENTRATVTSARKEMEDYRTATAVAKASLDHSLAERKQQLQELQATIERVSRQGQLDIQKLEDQKSAVMQAHEEQVHHKQEELAQLDVAISEAHARLSNLQSHIRGLHSSLSNLAQ